MSLPAPYFHDERAGITIYHGDCREILPLLGRFDLLLTDPPYGIAYKGGGGGNLIHSGGRKGTRKQETVIGDDAPFDPAHLLGSTGAALFGAQHYAARLPATGSFHCWDKRGSYKSCHLADFDLIWINRRTPGRIHRCVWRGLCREAEHDQKIVHPTQKPVSLMFWCLDFFPEAKTVVDPYMGSGPVAKACKDRGLRYVGIELVESYCAIAVDRLRQSVLFGAEGRNGA